MVIRVILLAALLSGCQSFATQTRVTANGGAFTLFPSSLEGVRTSLGDALTAITQQCGGVYEVMALEAVRMADADGAGWYLDLGGEARFGAFRTLIAYECHKPESPLLNDRLTLAAAEPPPAPPAAAAECGITYDCPVGSICEATPCDRGGGSSR
jgi:hypothetical protein